MSNVEMCSVENEEVDMTWWLALLVVVKEGLLEEGAFSLRTEGAK